MIKSSILRKLLFLSILFVSLFINAQTTTPPIYSTCDKELDQSAQEMCFRESVKTDFNSNFTLPSTVENSSFSVRFIASKSGKFEVLYVSHPNEAVKKQVVAVFSSLPKFIPATYNNHAIDKQFILPYDAQVREELYNTKTLKSKKKNHIIDDKFITSPKHKSNLSIPLSHQTYNQFSKFYFSKNTHTAVKPYSYQEVSENVNFDSINTTLMIDKTSWFGRKFWNENMLQFKGDYYWFHVDPVADLQLGKDNSDAAYTYNNTRALRIEGGLGKMLTFSSAIFESQGRFADYFNSQALVIRPASQGYAVIPGRDISKSFKDSSFDYPLSTGTINFTPAKFMDIQFGRDKNFIGDGYRSLFLSDVGAPYTFVKIKTRFWNIQYTNLWTWLRDVNVPMGVNDPYKKKYMAMHYLSWNATKKLNIALFESVTWAKTEDRGFDVEYLNPVVIYRAIEYANGSTGGNAMLGLSAKYNFKQTLQLYSQFVLDELTMSEFVNADGYWANKYGIQVGAKYFNAFKIPNLTLQGEYNHVRPFTYSHSRPSLHYGHVNQPLAHLWGSNFKEIIAIADYKNNRWFGTAKLTAGVKGFDINSETDVASYGGDIFRNYSDRNANHGVEIGQGNKAKIIIGELQAGYLLNPATNLKVFGSVLYRDFNTPLPNIIFENKTTTWFNVGFRTDINNWYFDF